MTTTRIPVRQLSRLDRTAMERHLLALEAEDRRLRFGIFIGDPAVTEYVARIDFDRDAAFGVFDDDLALLGAAHLARGGRHAELGVSVLPGQRGQGIGGALLERAHLHARNWGERALFMHCLAENGAMMHLARKQGMAIGMGGGEADAWLELPPADAATHFGEVFAQRVALFDYALKSQLSTARRLAAALAEK
ncbi:MAG TPA: GNAT family N-acetyltransferase [Burkholderiales bacterium]|nr:GNAT family N-acetyltransferase [Burkholderiales bacterium]